MTPFKIRGTSLAPKITNPSYLERRCQSHVFPLYWHWTSPLVKARVLRNSNSLRIRETPRTFEHGYNCHTCVDLMCQCTLSLNPTHPLTSTLRATERNHCSARTANARGMASMTPASRFYSINQPCYSIPARDVGVPSAMPQKAAPGSQLQFLALRMLTELEATQSLLARDVRCVPLNRHALATPLTITARAGLHRVHTRSSARL